MSMVRRIDPRRRDLQSGNPGRCRGQHARELDAAVAVHVLQRSLRRVLVDRAVVRVVVGYGIQVQRRVHGIAGPRERGHLPGQGEALQAEAGDEPQDEGQAAHGSGRSARTRQNLYVARIWYSRGAPGATQIAA